MENWKTQTDNNKKKNLSLKKLIVACFGIVLLSMNMPLIGQQQYFPFPTDSAKWSEWCGSSETYPYPHWEYTTTRFFLNGDTTIDSKEYALIYGYSSPSEIIDTTTASLMGGLREDSLKNIYFIPMITDPGCVCNKCNISPFPPEYILYSFDLEVGDTAFIGPSQHPFVVSTIDSILIDSNYRKKYSFSSYNKWTDRYWIEGIGSSYGLFGPMCDDPFEGYVELLCYEDQITNYSKYGYCYEWYYVSVPEINKDDLFIAYSNPDYEKLYFKLKPSVKGTEIQLYNISGNKLKSLTCKSGQDEYIMDLNNIPSGLYIAVLLNNGQVVNRKKVIVAK